MPRRMFALPIFALFCVPLAAQEAKAPAFLAELERFVADEVKQKKIPSVSIAVVDGDRTIWAKAFGSRDLKGKHPATPETNYRVGSVSKLFTDICVMQLVEEKKLDLDAPVAKYLPEFQPANQFSKPITLRQLMTHRSGLIRESPVGNYFDPTEPGLEKTIASLRGIPLVYEPEARIKYSNAAIAAVGRVVEKIDGKPFAQIARERVLDRVGMAHSSFVPTPEIVETRAEGEMTTYFGRRFPAPTFELGMAPAGCMWSTADDLAKFVKVLFKNGEGILKPESLQEMLTPQFAPKDSKNGFGLGFMLGELDGHTRIGHGGAIYGFATELAFLPKEKLGVVVIASKDVFNGWTTNVADEILRSLLAEKEEKAGHRWTVSHAISNSDLEGRYTFKDKSIDVTVRDGRLMLVPNRGGFWSELRRDLHGYLIDDGINRARGFDLDEKEKTIRIGADVYQWTPLPKTPPPAPPAEMLGLIGEYGWDHNVLYIFEKDGELWCDIEWIFLYPLKRRGADVWEFPNFGLYHGETLAFTRDEKGKAKVCVAAQVAFPRRTLDGEGGKTFKIEPTRLVKELEPLARAARPPAERKKFRTDDFVELTKLDPAIKTDLRYATANNFLGTPLYPKTARAYMQAPAAKALIRANEKLAEYGLGALVFDSYRPWYVTKLFWEATPDKFHNFVADPASGSRHNRGCAVDLGLYDRKTGQYVDAVGGYDEFSDRAYPDYIGGSSRQRWHRDLLRRVMESEGFAVYTDEWWHFDYRDWTEYGIGNRSFEELQKSSDQIR